MGRGGGAVKSKITVGILKCYVALPATSIITSNYRENLSRFSTVFFFFSLKYVVILAAINTLL